jgi:hypothetical protein
LFPKIFAVVLFWLLCLSCEPSKFQKESEDYIEKISNALSDWHSNDTPKVFLQSQVILGGVSKVLQHYNVQRIVQSGWSYKDEQSSDILLHSILIDSDIERSALCHWFTVEKQAQPVCTENSIHIIQLLSENPNWLDFKSQLSRLRKHQVTLKTYLSDLMKIDKDERLYFFPKKYLRSLTNCFEVSYVGDTNRYFHCHPAEVNASFSSLQDYMNSNGVLVEDSQTLIDLKKNSLYLQWRSLQSNPGGEAVTCGDYIIGAMYYSDKQAYESKLAEIYEKCI